MVKKLRMPCGPRFCPAALRLLWPIKTVKVRDIARLYGVTPPEIERRAEELTIYGLRPHRRTMVYSKAEFKRLWENDALTLEDIGECIGMVPRVVTNHARKLGLPERKCGPKPTYTFDEDFDALWRAKVSCQEIARHYGGCSKSLIGIEAKRRKLPPRPRAGKLHPIATVLEALAAKKLAEAMRREAEIADLARKIRAHEHGQTVPETIMRRAQQILGDRRAA